MLFILTIIFIHISRWAPCVYCTVANGSCSHSIFFAKAQNGQRNPGTLQHTWAEGIASTQLDALAFHPMVIIVEACSF